MDELIVRFPTGEEFTTVVRDLHIDFEGGLEGIRLQCTETATNAIKRTYPLCQVWKGEKRLA